MGFLRLDDLAASEPLRVRWALGIANPGHWVIPGMRPGCGVFQQLQGNRRMSSWVDNNG